MKKFIIISGFLFLLSFHVYSQGCIAVRSINGFGQYDFTNNTFSTSGWQLNLTYRYFKSFRDFKESIDQETPAQNKSMNETYTLDVSLSKMLIHG